MVNPQKNVSLNDTVFPVIEVPAVFTNNNMWTKNTGHKFIVREDTKEVLSCMTDEYKMVSNYEVIEEVAPIMKKSKAQFREAQIFGNGSRTKWTWHFPDIKVKVGKDDVLNPEINIWNSYDGSTELSFTAGAYRIVCSNGLIIGTIIDRKRNRHSVYNTNLNKISEQINDTVNKCNTVFADSFTQLIETAVKPTSVPRIVKELPQQAIEPFVRYCGRTDIKNYWDLLNAFTWVTTHALNRKHESTHKLENRVYPIINKLAAVA